MQQCNLRLLVKFLKSGVSLFLEYRNSFVPTEQARNIASTVDKIMSSILSSPKQIVQDADFFSERNRLQVERWNSTALEHVKRTVHDVIMEMAKSIPQEQAVCSWDGDLTYSALIEYASEISAHLIEQGVGAEVIVPLCFDKSKWNVVAMLGVLMAGGCCKLYIIYPTPLPLVPLSNLIRPHPTQLQRL
jgi:non-ribosomal peptide synthetase component F